MEENEDMHRDPNNWKLGIFYFNPKDKRVLVLKRLPGFGFTFNFANPYSILIILGIIAFIFLVSRK